MGINCKYAMITRSCAIIVIYVKGRFVNYRTYVINYVGKHRSLRTILILQSYG